MAPTVTVDGIEAHARAFASRFGQLAAAARMVRGDFLVAIPGGSVARAFLPALAGAPLDWSKVHVFWCDERAVPPDSPDSNVGLARSLLFAGAARGAKLHPMPGDAADPVAAAAAYARELEMTAGLPVTLDLVLLGVGEDGHVASLFPGAPSLGELVRPVLAVDGAPKPPPRRFTLTLPVLLRAREVVVAAFGASKAAAVKEALHNAESQSPLALLVRGAARISVLIDADAAG